LIPRCSDAQKSKHIAKLRTDMNVTRSLIASLNDAQLRKQISAVIATNFADPIR